MRTSEENEEMNTPPKFEAQGFRFDKTVTAGNVLTALAMMIAGGMAFLDYRIAFERHENRITATEKGEVELFQRSSDEAKARADMTRALDKLASTIEARDKYQHPAP